MRVAPTFPENPTLRHKMATVLSTSIIAQNFKHFIMLHLFSTINSGWNLWC